MVKRILIVSYIFPPYPGMGGRRWVKFAKELAGRGFEVDVICAQNPFSESSFWNKDAEHAGIHCYLLPNDYPAILSRSPVSLFQKFWYKLNLLFLQLFTRGNYYDRSVFWRLRAKRKARALILKHAHRQVVVTGAPFRMMTDILSLKEEFEGLKICCDLRDLWVNNREAYGIHNLPARRVAFEANQELQVLKQADQVIVVVEPMLRYLAQRSPENAHKLFLLDNGYDPDDFASKPTPVPGNTGALRLVLTGTLSQGYRYVWHPLLNTLEKLKNEDRIKYNLFRFDFYGTTPEEFRRLAEEKGLDIIHCHPPVPLREVPALIDSAHVCMFFNYQTQNYVFGIKFYEYITRRRRLALFSEEGASSEFIRQNKLGYCLNPGNIQEMLLQMLDDFQNNRMGWESSFDPAPFSVQVLTDRLLEITEGHHSP